MTIQQILEKGDKEFDEIKPTIPFPFSVCSTQQNWEYEQ